MSIMLSKLLLRSGSSSTNELELEHEEAQHAVAFDEYKQYMEEVQVNNPHLSVGAQQQMALKRCCAVSNDKEFKPKENNQQKRFSIPNLGGLMQKFLVHNSDEEDRPSASSSTKDSASTQHDKGRTIAARHSVFTNSMSVDNQKMLLDCYHSDEEDSLDEILESIEKQSAVEKSVDRSKRAQLVGSFRRFSSRRLLASDID